MENESLDDMLKHLITDEELTKEGITRSYLGIKLELLDGKRVYFDKKGVAIQMENGTYLTAADLLKWVLARYAKKSTCHDLFSGEGP